MQYSFNNISNPILSSPIDPAPEVGKTALTMVQKGILDAKIKKLSDREEILEENLKRSFTILHGKCTEIPLVKFGGDRKYEAIERDQDIIEILKLIK